MGKRGGKGSRGDRRTEEEMAEGGFRGEEPVKGKNLEERREGGLRGEGDEACSSGFLSLM